MYQRPDLRNQNPWVQVDKETWHIIRIGTFEEINKSEIKGHIMTLSLRNQILEERYGMEMSELSEELSLPNKV